LSPHSLFRKLTDIQYKRNDIDFKRGTFRSAGDIVEIFPSHSSSSFWKISFFGDEVESISEMSFPDRKKIVDLPKIKIFSNSHYVTTKEVIDNSTKQIMEELQIQLKELEERGKVLEKERLRQRTLFDLEMMQSTGSCSGIENYSRYLTGRSAGEPPPTLLEYFQRDSLLVVDESHVSIPQLHAMYAGDRSRKTNLVEYGFRLPSCLDNRPLKFEEWEVFRPNTIYLSATPGGFELLRSGENVVEQLIRPTGIVDPRCDIRPSENQIDDLMDEIQKTRERGFRTLVTTLTKKMAEQLTEYLFENGFKVAYIHSDTETLDRIEIIKGLKSGEFDVLVGINLLREGLDIPECGLVAILDADKEGYLRSRTALIQTVGRAARNVEGRAILYADAITQSMESALTEIARIRTIQEQYNQAHGIIPRSIQSAYTGSRDGNPQAASTQKASTKEIAELEKLMLEAAENLRFEEAANYRDKIKKLAG
jgi:excinuclease ABC subunit B